MKVLTKAIKLALYGSVAGTSICALAETPEVLDPIEIQTKISDPRTTEGTGSYTAASTAISSGIPLAKKDTPQSVSVLTNQQMRDQNLTTVSKALESVTGVSRVQIDRGRDTYFARGFQIDRYQVDGLAVNYPAAYGSGETTLDNVIYDRIEVVRGSTGLMTGSGNPSASVNLVRKHANSTSRHTILEGGIASHQHFNGMIDHTQPLTADGSVRARVVASYQGGDTFIDRETDKRKTLYGVIDADLTPNTKFSAGVSYQAVDRDGVMWGNLPAFINVTGAATPTAADVIPSNWNVGKSTSPSWTFWDSDTYNYFVNVEHKFNDDWKISLLGNQRIAEGNSKLFYLSGQTVRASDGLGGRHHQIISIRKPDNPPCSYN